MLRSKALNLRVLRATKTMLLARRTSALRRPCLQWSSSWRLPRAFSGEAAASTAITELEDDAFQRPFDQSPESFKALWERIRKTHSEKSALDVVKEWKEEGNEFSRDLMHSILHRLCARSWFTQADKVANWLDEQKAYELNEEDDLFRLEILCRRGDRWNKAYKVFQEYPNKTEAGYLVILNAAATSLEIWRAEKLMKDLKESKLMTSGRAYTSMIRMYIRAGKTDKALQTYKEFDASGLPEDPAMYWYLLTYKDTIFSSVPVLEKAAAALERFEQDVSNRRDLLKMYALLDNSEAVDRVWNEMKAPGSKLWKVDYLSAIGAYDKIGRLDKAEEVSQQLEAIAEGDISYGHRLLMLRVYARNGKMDKAQELLAKLSERPSFEQVYPMIEGYLKLGEFDKALNCFKKYMDVGDAVVPRGMKQVANAMVKLNEEFAKRGDVKGAEALLAMVPRMERVKVYNSLLKVYLAAKTPAYAFERRMEAAKAVPDDETKSLLAQLAALEGGEAKEESSEQPASSSNLE